MSVFGHSPRTSAIERLPNIFESDKGQRFNPLEPLGFTRSFNVRKAEEVKLMLMKIRFHTELGRRQAVACFIAEGGRNFTQKIEVHYCDIYFGIMEAEYNHLFGQ
jgi:hypothetical protein